MSLLPQSKEQYGIDLFIFQKQFNYIIFPASDLHFITHGSSARLRCSFDPETTSVVMMTGTTYLIQGKRFIAQNLN